MSIIKCIETFESNLWDDALIFLLYRLDYKGDVWATSLQKIVIVVQVVWEIWPQNEGGIIFEMVNFGGSIESIVEKQ